MFKSFSRKNYNRSFRDNGMESVEQLGRFCEFAKTLQKCSGSENDIARSLGGMISTETTRRIRWRV